MEAVIKFTAEGVAKAIYSEAIDMSCLGKQTIKRASHVEPTDDGQWTADMGPSCGPVLGPFGKRSDALKAETDWLKKSL